MLILFSLSEWKTNGKKAAAKPILKILFAEFATLLRKTNKLLKELRLRLRLKWETKSLKKYFEC